MTPRDIFPDSPNAPLPGTEAPKKALFIDRWGTLLELPPRGHRARFADAEFTDRALDSLFRASQAGWAIYLIGNEDAVARGRISEHTWETFERDLLEAMAAAGVSVARNYACLEHPVHGKGVRMKDSVFLLPNTGAMYHSMQHDGIHLGGSWVIGDSTIELAAGWRAGCRTAGVRTGLATEDGVLEIDPEFVADDLTEVLAQILRLSQVARH